MRAYWVIVIGAIVAAWGTGAYVVTHPDPRNVGASYAVAGILFIVGALVALGVIDRHRGGS